jgi:hypothetical protein
LFRVLRPTRTAWIAATLAVAIMITGVAVAAMAAVSAHKGGNGGRGPYICRPDGRRTIHYRGVGYIVRNDVFYPERECIKLVPHEVGFVVIKSHADSHVGDNNDAFPEVIYGCEWGVCSYHSSLPRRVYRLRVLYTSWSTSWRRANGWFNVAYDIWFGHLHEWHGQVRGAELMIWLGTKKFGTPSLDPIVHIDGQRWYYAHHVACDQFGCWNYVLFRRVVPTTREVRLSVLPFIVYGEKRKLISWHWFLKSVDAGFEIWQKGRGLTVHSYVVRLRLYTIKKHHHHHRHNRK